MFILGLMNNLKYMQVVICVDIFPQMKIEATCYLHKVWAA